MLTGSIFYIFSVRRHLDLKLVIIRETVALEHHRSLTQQAAFLPKTVLGLMSLWPDDSPSLWGEGKARHQELVQISLRVSPAG